MTGAPAPAAPTTGLDSSETRRYDFRRPTKLSREQAHSLFLAMETFARQFTTGLTTSLRAIARVDLTSFDQQTYDEYVATLESPTFLAVLDLNPSGTGVLEFSLPVAHTMVDHMLGGSGAPQQPNRPLTAIETRVVTRLVERILTDLGYSLRGAIPLTAALKAVEHNPSFAQVAAAADPVLVAKFDCAIGTISCTASLCLPLSPVQHLLDTAAPSLSERERAERERFTRDMTAAMSDVPIDVAVRFVPSPHVALDLAALSVGDEILLNHSTSQPLQVTAADNVFGFAEVGTVGRRLGVAILTTPTHDDEIED